MLRGQITKAELVARRPGKRASSFRVQLRLWGVLPQTNHRTFRMFIGKIMNAELAVLRPIRTSGFFSRDSLFPSILTGLAPQRPDREIIPHFLNHDFQW